MDPETGLQSYPDKFFSLAIVDPEYGIGAAKMNMGLGVKKWTKGKSWDAKPPSKEYFNEIFRVSKNQIIWGGNYFTDKIPVSKGWIFWDKDQVEGISFSDGELAWTSFDFVLKKVRIEYAGFRGNDLGGKIHPTQKPVALYRWLLENYAKPGDLILDTHVGSASSLIACEQMGFEYHAFELDPDYYEAAVNRMSKGIQTNLFAHGTNAPQNRDEQLTIF